MLTVPTQMNLSTVYVTNDMLKTDLYAKVNVNALKKEIITKVHKIFNYKIIISTFFLDIDECVINIDNCHSHAYCTDTNGSFYCTCNHGYTGNGTFCEGFFSL